VSSEDGNLMPKHVGATIYTVAFVDFFTQTLTKRKVKEAKSPVKISSGNVARRDLIPALKG
jgi:hypothetical protein